MEIFLWVLLGFIILLAPTAYAGFIGAPYAPTRIAAIRKAFNAINLNSNDVLVDLGAGDGKILLEAEKRGARAYGYELSPIFFAVSWLRTFRHKNINVRYANFYNQKFPDATILFCFLMPDKMSRLEEVLRKQDLTHLRYVLIYAFPFKNLTPDLVIREPNTASVYIYEAEQFRAQNS